MFDVDDKLEIRVSGPEKHIGCKIAVTVGKEEILDFHTLIAYPTITFRVVLGVARNHHLYYYLSVHVRSVPRLVSPIPMQKGVQNWSIPRIRGLCVLPCGLSREGCVSDAREGLSGDTSLSANGFAVLIVFIDLTFVALVGVFILGNWFREMTNLSLGCLPGVLCCLPAHVL